MVFLFVAGGVDAPVLERVLAFLGDLDALAGLLVVAVEDVVRRLDAGEVVGRASSATVTPSFTQPVGADALVDGAVRSIFTPSTAPTAVVARLVGDAGRGRERCRPRP